MSHGHLTTPGTGAAAAFLTLLATGAARPTHAQTQPVLACDAARFTGLGLRDGALSVQSTIEWYDKFRINNGGDVSDFARFYPTPWMARCGAGPATDRIGAFAALVGWVERGTPPGDLEAAASFVCA